MKNFAIFGKRDGASGIHGPPHVLLFDIARAGAERDSATAVHAAYMAPRDSHYGEFYRHIGDAFGLLQGATDGAYRGIQINDEALARPFGLSRAHSQESGAAIFDIGYQRARFRTPNIQRGEIALFLPH